MFTISNDVPKEIKEAIVKMVDKKGNLSSVKVRNAPEWFTQWFKEHENVMSPRALFNLIKNGLDYIPFCEYCHTTQLTPEQYQKGHYYCCNQHAQLDSKTQEKMAKTFADKYENGHPLKDPKIRKKIKKTNLKRYGNVVACNTEEWQEKIKQRNLEKYGVEHCLQRPDVILKRKNSYVQTCMERYGVTNTSKVPEIKERIERHRKITVWEKMQFTAEDHNLEILSTMEDWIENHSYDYKCLECGNKFTSKLNPFKIVCERCHPKHTFVSKKETEVADWIRSIYTGTVETSNRSIINPFELDIYIPDKHLAVEFDGMYWHSDRFKEKDYHQNKSILCMEKGVRLIHVPELVWDKRTRFIKSIIKNALGLTENKIYARETQVTEIDSLSYRIFLNENHMQGAIDSKYKYGLLYNGDLVSVMGFGDSRFKKNEQELHRFCSKLDWNVVGGFQKLLKHSGFHGISYVDLNYFDGSGYKEAGFEFVSYTEPSYVWLSCETGMIYSRYQTQKHKLEKLLEFFEPTLSETDNMLLNGYIKIYDSGTMKLKYE